MAVQTALVKHYDKKVLLIGSHDLVFLTPPKFSINLKMNVVCPFTQWENALLVPQV